MNSVQLNTVAKPPVLRQRLLTIVVTVLTLMSVVIAVLQPAWLTEPLRSAVQNAGPAAPLVFVVLCALAAPVHLNGAVVALSSVSWPLPVALALSYVGSLLGSVVTATLLARASGTTLRRHDAWPRWLQRLSAQVTRHPVLIGLAARIAIGSGMALEAFYVLTGYSRRQYLVVTVPGVAIWVTQMIVGVQILRALVQLSASYAVLAFIAPMLPVLIAALVMPLIRRRRQR